MEPLLCVVTTIYNARAVLPITLASLLSQTSTRFIHVIYDDGSADDCSDLIARYKESCIVRGKGPDVLYLRGQTNMGCDLAHQFCFAHLPIECTHFCWLDAGDWVVPSFVERFYKIATRHSRCNWFHFNSRHYDKDSSEFVGKDSYHSFWKRYLRANEQWPAIAFKQFYYHVMIIEKAFFLSVNPQVYIGGPAVHGGAFYDAQIVASLSVARAKMHYEKKCLVYVLSDPNSVAASFSSMSGKGDIFLFDYLRQLDLPSASIRAYERYLQLCFEISQWNVRMLKGTINNQNMKLQFKSLANHIRQNRLPRWFFPRKLYYWLVLKVSGCRFAVWLYVKLMRI